MFVLRPDQERAPFSVIVPIHVAHQLSVIPGGAADRIRRELLVVAQRERQLSGLDRSGRATDERTFEESGYRLRYSVDFENRAVVANELTTLAR